MAYFHRVKTPKHLLVFNQDGNQFYSFNGAKLFEAKCKVNKLASSYKYYHTRPIEYDLKQSESALKEFLIWADNHGYRPQRG